MTKPVWIKWCPKDALDGTMTLGPWEELAYRRLLDLIYSTGDNLPDDDRKLGWMTKTGARWKKIKKTLLEEGKIEIVDGRITNARCQETLQESIQFFVQRVEAGKASARKRKSLKNNKTASTVVATVAHTSVPSNHNIDRDIDLDSSLRSESISISLSPPLRLSPPDLDEDDEVPFLRDDPAPEPPPPAEQSPEPDPEPAPAPEPTTKPKPKPAKPTTAAKRGERLTAEEPPPEWLDWAREAGHRAPEREWQVFRDYWIAQPGQKGIKLDWFATWRNWIRRDLGGGTAPPRRSRRAGMAEPSPAEAFRRTPEEIEEIEKAIAEW